MLAIYLLFPLLMLCSASVAVAASSAKIKPEQLLPVTAMSIIVILYLSYIFNMLLAGFVITIIIGCGCYLFAFICIVKNPSKILRRLLDILKRFFTPGMAVFILAVTMIYLVTRSSKVFLWDELRLWGAYPKALYYTNQLQLGTGEGVLIYPIMQSYPPGMMLFAYFFERFVPIFYEGYIFFAYGILGATLFIPMLEKLTWEKGWLVIPLAFAVFVIPTFFFNNQMNDLGDYYTSLFIDPLLGLFVAYTVFLFQKEPFGSWFSTLRFTLAVFVTILIKDSGISFIVIILVASLVISLVDKSFRKTTIIQRVLCILIALFSSLSWKIAMQLNGVNASIPFNIAFPAQGLHKLFIAFRTVPLLHTTFPSFLPPMIFLLLISLILFINLLVILNTNKKERKHIIFSSITLYICNVIFIIGLAILYSNNALKGVGSLPSYPRYICTLLLADFAFIFMCVVELFVNGVGCKKKIWYSYTYSTVCIAFLAIMPFHQPQSYTYAYNSAEVQDDVETILSDLNNWDNSSSIKNVYLLINGDILSNSGFHHRVYFDLIGKDIYIKNFFDKTNLIELQVTKQQWANELINEQYDYVYLTNADDAFIKGYGDLFDSVIEKKLYKVTVENGIVKLIHQ